MATREQVYGRSRAITRLRDFSCSFSVDSKNMSHLDEFAAAFLGIFQSHRLEQKPDIPIESLSLEDAYLIQQKVIDARVSKSERPVGYKVGCTSRAIRQQFGLSEPICGRLMQPHVYYGDTVLDWSDFHRPAVEAEFALVIGKDLTEEVGPDERFDDAVEYASQGIEVHHFDWWFGQPSSQELIASNGIHACLVLGRQKVSPKQLDWDMEGIGLFRNGDLDASGIGAEVMGGPMRSLRWLVNHLVRRGEPLRAGQIVISGSAVPLVRVEQGDRVAARFTRIGRIEAEFR